MESLRGVWLVTPSQIPGSDPQFVSTRQGKEGMSKKSSAAAGLCATCRGRNSGHRFLRGEHCMVVFAGNHKNMNIQDCLIVFGCFWYTVVNFNVFLGSCVVILMDKLLNNGYQWLVQ